MLSKYIRHAVFAAAIVDLAAAQQSKVVPQDLQGGFDEDVQVAYDNNAVDGFLDGTTFEKDGMSHCRQHGYSTNITTAVAKEPTFALGDSSGIIPSKRYTILMVDTTCDNARTLHFARTNFKYNFDVVKIESETNAQQEYKAPGSLGETGDDRKYSFLMYTQTGGKEISDLKLPGEGEQFDVKKFQDDNGFQDAEAGIGMVVKLGGESNCDGSPSGGGGQESQSSSSPEPASSAAAEPASSAAAEPAPSSAAEEASSAAPSRTPVASQAQSSGPSATPNEPNAPESAPAEATQTADNEQPSATGGQASGQTSDLAIATTALQSGAAPSTLILSSVVPNATASSPTTGAPAQQTTNAASGLTFGESGYMVLGSVMALAGLLVW